MIIIAEKIEQKHIKTALKIYNYYIANSLSKEVKVGIIIKGNKIITSVMITEF